MAIPILLALLIHIIWLTRVYRHISPIITQRVRNAGAIASLVISTVLLCLIWQFIGEQMLNREELISHQLPPMEIVSLVSLPDNSGCYATVQQVDPRHK